MPGSTQHANPLGLRACGGLPRRHEVAEGLKERLPRRKGGRGAGGDRWPFNTTPRSGGVAVRAPSAISVISVISALIVCLRDLRALRDSQPQAQDRSASLAQEDLR